MKPPSLAPLVFAAAVAACSPGETPPNTPRVVLVQPAETAASLSGSYTGEIRARHEADLSFRVGGKIAARLVDNGSAIKTGQLIATLDPTDLQSAAKAARAQLASAEADFATARAEHQRYADLLARGFVSQATYDAKANALTGTQGRLEQARAQSQISNNQAAYGSLSADYPAVVIAVLANAGQVVTAGQPVFRVARSDEKEIAISIPENRVHDIKNSASATVSLWANPGIRVAAVLRELSAAADSATRTYAARFRLIDPPPEVKLGMTARIDLAPLQDKTPILVPLPAVLDTGKGPFVRVARDGKVASLPVEVAQFREDGALIAKGLRKGDLVIISGANQLADAQAVEARVVTPPAHQR